MTLSIRLSSLAMSPEQFGLRVTSFIAAMVEYAAHLEGVKLDAANPDLKPEQRRVAFPPPSEDPLIEQAAHEGYVLAGPTLEEKKAALTAQVKQAEVAALNEIVPPHKARHWHFREQDIQAKRAAEWAKEQPTITVGDEDDLFMQDMANRHAKQQQVVRWSAKHEHDIGDLTEETVDHYEIGKTFA